MAPDVLQRHEAVLVCPVCHGRLAPSPRGALCVPCDVAYPRRGYGYDFGPAGGMTSGLGPLMLRDPLHVPRYERRTRAPFLSIMGSNWAGDLSVDDEDRYLRTHVRPVEGPVLDLACGAGRWTRVIAGAVGDDRVIALDLSVAMLEAIRATLPDLCVVRGSALSLPFGREALGAVVCWNALQVLPDPPRVVREVGRCLRPGGTFTALTFRPARDPLYRACQRRHHAAFKVAAFSEEQIRDWLDDAGLDVVDLGGPGSFLLLNAVKSPPSDGQAGCGRSRAEIGAS